MSLLWLRVLEANRAAKMRTPYMDIQGNLISGDANEWVYLKPGYFLVIPCK